MKRKRFNLFTKISLTVIGIGIMVLLLNFLIDIQLPIGIDIIGIFIAFVGLMMLMGRSIVRLLKG